MAATAFDPQVREKLAKTFGVTEEECDVYNGIYETNILPRIRKKYMAHMVASVEEMIDEKVREKEAFLAEARNKDNNKNQENQPKQEAGKPKVRRYSIVLSDKKPPKNGKAAVWSLDQGAIITYEPKNDQRDLRIFISHELGHLLIEYGILPGKNTEDEVNLLAFCAINGKNEFYRKDAPAIVYKGRELEIIERIETVCR